MNPSDSSIRKRKAGLTVTGRIHLSSVVKDLQELRGTGQPVSAIRRIPLVQLLVEETKFLRAASVKPSTVVPLLLEKLGTPKDSPLGQAGLKTALKAEESFLQPNYHNHQHVVEVVVAAYILGCREKLPAVRVAELVLAAAAHDLGHTGRMNQFDYEREEHSFQVAQPIFQATGLAPDTIERIRRMILATDFRVGVPPTRQAYLEARFLPPQDEQRLLAVQCLLLTEADVLFSCFDLSYNELLSKLLSAEWQRPNANLTLQERTGFLSRVQFLSDASLQLGLEKRRLKLLEELSNSAKAS